MAFGSPGIILAVVLYLRHATFGCKPPTKSIESFLTIIPLLACNSPAKFKLLTIGEIAELEKLAQFLKEENNLLIERALSQDLESDDKGKLHELLLAKYLHPEQRLPEHHRSFSDNPDHAGTPEQVHDKLKEKIPPAAYNEIDKHARQSADAFRQSLKDQGQLNDNTHIGNVHWTSNADKPNVAGDHEKTTGVKDVNSNADLIARIADKAGNIKHVGISAKYGSREPNYANPGLESLEKHAGMPKGTLNKHMEAHRANMEKLGYEGSDDQKNIQTKLDEGGIGFARDNFHKLDSKIQAGGKLKGKEKMMHANAKAFIDTHDGLPEKQRAQFLSSASQRAATARAGNLQARKEMAKEFHSHLAKKSPEELAGILRNSVSPPTHIPHIVAHSKVKDDGSAESIIKPMHSIADDHFSQFDMHTLTPHVANGTSVTFKAKNLKNGKPMNVGMINIKSSSGAHKSAVGSLKLKAD